MPKAGIQNIKAALDKWDSYLTFISPCTKYLHEATRFLISTPSAERVKSRSFEFRQRCIYARGSRLVPTEAVLSQRGISIAYDILNGRTYTLTLINELNF